MRMEYSKRIVAFIDILGFAKLIRESADQDKKDIALSKLNIIYNLFSDMAKPTSMQGETTQFSDSIVVSIPYDDEDGAFHFIYNLQHLIMNLAGEEILCRGGIAIGELYHKGSTVFGPALVDAYSLESKVANYPRVIVGPNIIKIAKTYKGNQNTEEEVENQFKNLLGFDTDGFYYIDYLDIALELEPYEYSDYLNTIHAMIEKGLKNQDITIRAKLTWLGLKFNDIIMRLKMPGIPLAKIEHLIITGVNDKYK